MAMAMSGLCPFDSASAPNFARRNETVFSSPGSAPCGVSMTGLAAPMVALGVITMCLHAYATRAPADEALNPSVMYAMVGQNLPACWIDLVISRPESTRPPGVSMMNTAPSAPSA